MSARRTTCGVLLALLILLPGATAQFACGDCDLNGPVSIIDALVAAQMAAALLTPTLDQDCTCDVDNSGSVGIIDALIMAQEAAGLMPGLTCPSNPCGATGLTENFTTTTRRDPASTALWNDAGSPGVLTGNPSGGVPTLDTGTGVGGPLTLTTGPHSIDTDTGNIDSSPSAAFDPGTGEFHFTDIDIQSGADVQVQGSVPLVMRATGTATVAGTIDASGGDGQDGDMLSIAAGAGGAGRAGGGDGGDADITGGNGGNGDSPIGPGGGGMGGEGVDGNNCSLLGGAGPCVGVPGAGGGFGTEGGFGFDFEGLGRDTISNPTYGNPPYLDPVIGGSGGGAGGGIFGAALFGGQTDCSGGGGGAGGGAVQIAAGGLVSITGLIDVSGGSGGQAGAMIWSASGGAGSGGAIKIESLVDVSLGSAAILDASGGFGGPNYSQFDIFGGVPRSPATDIENDNGFLGGDGGAGRIVLRDLDGVVTGLGFTSPPATVSTLGATSPGSGVGGSLTVPDEGIALINTSTGEIDTGSGPAVSPGFTGAGVFEFADIDIGEGAYLLVLGTDPLTLRATGNATMRGYIELGSIPGFAGAWLFAFNALGVAGGGDGGAGGPFAPDPGPWLASNGAGAGGGFAGDGFLTTGGGTPPDTIGVSGGGAGHAVVGTTAGSSTCLGAPPFSLPISPLGDGGATYGTATSGEGGSGGGGGGGSTVLGDGSQPGNAGGGGGPGGGSLTVQTGGILSFSARVNANGSRGGNCSYPVSTLQGMGGSGGGGSGGSVFLQGGAGLNFQGSITANGGLRGTIRDVAGLSAFGCTGIVLDAGDAGDGAPGFIHLEDPTGATLTGTANVDGNLAVDSLPGGGCNIETGISIYLDSGLATPDYDPPVINATPATPGVAGAGGEMWTVVYFGADDAAGTGEIGPFTDINSIDGKPFFRFVFTLTSCSAAPVIDDISITWL